MALLKFTSALNRFFPDLQPTTVHGKSLLSLLNRLNELHPGLINYILDDQQMLRKHVNIFVDGEILTDRNNLELSIADESEVYIIQALSGG